MQGLRLDSGIGQLRFDNNASGVIKELVNYKSNQKSETL
jgi:hypothetical protein